jgi:serine/threonine-protein phosphatase PPG1
MFQPPFSYSRAPWRVPQSIICAHWQYAWPALYAPASQNAGDSLANGFDTASVDLDECIESLYKKNLLAESVIEAICAKTKELLMQESNVVHVQAPVTVVGDIHGQFFDLIEIFKIGGWCPDTNYLFLGMHKVQP